MRFTTEAMLLLVCALSVFLNSTATCQTPVASAPLEIGTRVRVSSSTPGLFRSPRVATVLAEQGDTLSLRPEGTQDSLALPLGSITRLEVSAGTGSRVGRGMGLGLLGGAVIGAVWGAASYGPCGCDVPLSRGGHAALGGLGGGLIGLFVGGFIGAGLETENWKGVAVTARAVSVRIAPSGNAGLMVSATF